jgi:hypothetical protein
MGGVFYVHDSETGKQEGLGQGGTARAERRGEKKCLDWM